MKRRHFLLAGAAAATLPIATAVSARADAAPRRFALAHRADAADCWRDAADRRDAACSPRIRLTLRGIQASATANPLAAFDVELLHRTSTRFAAPIGYRWAHLSRGPVPTRSKPLTLEFDADQLAALRVNYRWADAAASEMIALTDLGNPLLALGDYVLAGPRVDGSIPSLRTLGALAHDRCAIECAGDHDALLFSVSAA